MTISEILNSLVVISIWTVIIVVVYGIVTEEKEMTNNELASRIDSLHSVQMDSLSSISKRVNKYNNNVKIGLIDFATAEALALMEVTDE